MIWVMRMICTIGWAVVRGWHSIIGHPEDRVIVQPKLDGTFKLKCISCGADRVRHLRKWIR